MLYSLVAGQCVASFSSTTGNYIPGCVGTAMGLFIFQGQNELVDVNNTSSPGQWIPITPKGNIMSLVAKGPYELESTEFDATLTYTPNQPLRAAAGLGATAYKGQGQLVLVLALASSPTPALRLRPTPMSAWFREA